MEIDINKKKITILFSLFILGMMLFTVGVYLTGKVIAQRECVEDVTIMFNYENKERSCNVLCDNNRIIGYGNKENGAFGDIYDFK